MCVRVCVATFTYTTLIAISADAAAAAINARLYIYMLYWHVNWWGEGVAKIVFYLFGCQKKKNEKIIVKGIFVLFIFLLEFVAHVPALTFSS